MKDKIVTRMSNGKPISLGLDKNKIEFNLSEKIGVNYEQYQDAILIDDVKEFIKQIKEKIDKNILTDIHGHLEPQCRDLWLAKEIIDKLAGDKLK